MSVRGRASIRRSTLLCIGLLAAAGRGVAVQDRPPVSGAEVRLLIDVGRYTDAEAAERQFASDVNGDAGAESLAAAAAGDLLVEALWQDGKSSQPEVLVLAE